MTIPKKITAELGTSAKTLCAWFRFLQEFRDRIPYPRWEFRDDDPILVKAKRHFGPFATGAGN